MVQDLAVGVQDQAEVLAQRRERHLLDGVERVRALLGAALHHRVAQLAHVQRLVVAQVRQRLQTCVEKMRAELVPTDRSPFRRNCREIEFHGPDRSSPPGRKVKLKNLV